jgi:hypothetical protein
VAVAYELGNMATWQHGRRAVNPGMRECLNAGMRERIWYVKAVGTTWARKISYRGRARGLFKGHRNVCESLCNEVELL